jgi:hypothetical protein
MSMPFDRFSSGATFAGWVDNERLHRSDEPFLPVSPPRTRLLRFDWQWHGLIDPLEVPGPLEFQAGR